MKKIFSLVAAAMMAVSMFAANRTVTIDCTTAFSGQGTSSTGSEVTYTKDGVTFTCDKAYGTQYGVRCYTGGVIDISAGEENIVKITFQFYTDTKASKYYSGGLDTLQCVGDTDWTSGELASQARIEGNIVIELGDGTCQPIKHDTLDVTAAQALEIGGKLAAGASTNDVYRLKAYVAMAYDYDESYKNQSFYVSDDAQAETGEFFCKFTTGEVVAKGDQVQVIGKIEKYVKDSKTTIQMLRGVATVIGKTALENVYETVKAKKMIENGQLIFLHNGVKYNAVGAVVE